MTPPLLVLALALVAFANGANDNFKGVATLYGSATTTYRAALLWATLTVGLGSLLAALVAGRLVAVFSGAGLVPAALAMQPRFLLSVALAAAAAVLLASRLGLPVSTTHALLGALLGAGLMAARGAVAGGPLVERFVLPLVLSPVLAGGVTALLYPMLRGARTRLGVEREMCLCVGEQAEPVQVTSAGVVLLRSSGLALTVEQRAHCATRYFGTVIGFDAQRLLDRLHFLSAGAVGFARGMNDAPKIAALAVAGTALGLPAALAVTAALMALGGLLGARPVAETMSHRITGMNHGQAFTANAVTAALVLAASGFGLPVSTTHVATGALAGLGAVTGQARWRSIGIIALAWVGTLPLAALLGAALHLVLGR